MKKLLFLALSLSATVQAQNFSIDKNDRIEKTLIEQDQLIKDLQREVRQLRGDNEQINHQLQQLQQNQRDTEQRIGKTSESPKIGMGMTGMSGTTGNLNINNGMGMSGMNNMGMTPSALPPTQALVLPALSLADPKTTTAPTDYQQAFDLLQRGHYDKAIPAFESFIKQSPTGDYADNAQYWLGEAYYSKRDFVGALASFKKLVDNYPDSPKKSHALLKIGFSYDELGDKTSARQALEQVRKDFPSTMPARLADERLKKLH